MKELLIEFRLVDCGHLVQVWADGDQLHALAPCDVCEAVVRSSVNGVFPGVKITIVE